MWFIFNHFAIETLERLSNGDCTVPTWLWENTAARKGHETQGRVPTATHCLWILQGEYSLQQNSCELKNDHNQTSTLTLCYSAIYQCTLYSHQKHKGTLKHHIPNTYTNTLACMQVHSFTLSLCAFTNTLTSSHPYLQYLSNMPLKHTIRTWEHEYFWSFRNERKIPVRCKKIELHL